MTAEKFNSSLNAPFQDVFSGCLALLLHSPIGSLTNWFSVLVQTMYKQSSCNTSGGLNQILDNLSWSWDKSSLMLALLDVNVNIVIFGLELFASPEILILSYPSSGRRCQLILLAKKMVLPTCHLAIMPAVYHNTCHTCDTLDIFYLFAHT